MTPREERGLVIAALCKLNRTPEGWLVPSQSGERIYTVDPVKQTCTCPDHQEAGFKCKHIFAVEFTVKREVAPDGTVTETKSMTFTERVTYKRDHVAFNRAQSIEKDRFQELLADLCRGIPEPERTCRGRKPHLVKDAIFSMVFKVYSTFSSRRFTCDLQEAHRRGFISVAMPGVKVTAFHEDPAFTLILKQLVGESALPLRVVETKFAIDSSGFSTNKFVRWFDQKYGIVRQKHDWVKVHIACGVKTNVVTAVRILDKDAADSPQFIPLVKDTRREFSVGEVSADKAYLSVENFEEVAGCGGTAFIPFKENSTGGAGGLFKKMYHYFKFQQDEYMQHYHLRSNVESTFSMVKRKYGDSVRSRNPVAMTNEALCKFICHNLCCLIQEQCELGVEAFFWKDGETLRPTVADDAPKEVPLLDIRP